jgi:hypothetical protein
LSFGTTWMNLENIVTNDISQAQNARILSAAWSHWHMKYSKVHLTDTEWNGGLQRLGMRWRLRRCWWKDTKFHLGKGNKSRDLLYITMTIVNNISYPRKLLRE